MLINIIPVFSVIINFLDPLSLIPISLINKDMKKYIDYYTFNDGKYLYFIIQKINEINNQICFDKEQYFENIKLDFEKYMPIFKMENIDLPIDINNYVTWEIYNNNYTINGKFFINPHLNYNQQEIQYFQQKESSFKYEYNINIKYNSLEDKYYLTKFKIKFNKIQYLFYPHFSLSENILNVFESDNFCIQYIIFLIISFLALLLFLTGNFILVNTLEIIFN